MDLQFASAVETESINKICRAVMMATMSMVMVVMLSVKYKMDGYAINKTDCQFANKKYIAHCVEISLYKLI